MGIAKIFTFFLVFIIAVNISYSFQTNSSNYKQFPLIVSSGGEIVNSSNYKSYAATGIIAGVINSSTYKNWLGFFYTWLLADGQPCTANNQCEGGYCCSNLCSSSACPTEEEEVPAAAAAGGGAAGGGGAGGVFIPTEEEKEFTLSPEVVKTKFALGETSEETLKIKNTGDSNLSISLKIEGVKEYLSLSDTSFELKAGEEKEVTLSFIAKNVGSFTGQLIASSDEIEKSVPIILEVISKLVLFDVKLDIPSDYAEVEAGDDLKAQITLLNVGAPEKVDVFATYFIKDLRGNIIYEETETFAVEKQMSYAKSFRINEFVQQGNYVAVIEIRYADSFAVSSQLFRVVEEKAKIKSELIKSKNTLTFLVTAFAGVLALLIHNLIFVRKKFKKR